MEKVIVLPFVLRKLDNLVDVLFEKGYFAVVENAREYVVGIADFIKSIPKSQRYPTSNRKYGAWYSRYRPNKHTTWYIIFDTDGQTFLVRNLINNHTADYPTFIGTVGG